MPTLDIVPGLPGGADRATVRRLPHRVGAAHPSTGTGVDTPVQWFDTAQADAAAAVRAHVLFTLNVWAVDTDTITDAVVLVSELVVAVRDHVDAARLGVRAGLRADRVVVAVVEESPAEPPRGIGVPDVVDVDLADGVHSVQILDAMAAEWGFVRVDGVATAWFALPR